jgi:hypothetical protein
VKTKEQRMFEKLGHESLNPVDYLRPKRIAIVISNAANSTDRIACRFLMERVCPSVSRLQKADYEVEGFSPDGSARKADAVSYPHDPSRWSAAI